MIDQARLEQIDSDLTTWEKETERGRIAFFDLDVHDMTPISLEKVFTKTITSQTEGYRAGFFAACLGNLV